MFSKADKTKASASTARAAPSLISTDLQICGDLKTSGEMQVDGTVEGDISCSKLVIGEKAKITGEIEADEVVIKGQVKGRVKAGKVQLAKTARVLGDVWHDSLAIEAGAFLEGHCQRNDAAPAGTAATAMTPRVETVPARNRNAVAAQQSAIKESAGDMIAKKVAGS